MGRAQLDAVDAVALLVDEPASEPPEAEPPEEPSEPPDDDAGVPVDSVADEDPLVLEPPRLSFL